MSDLQSSPCARTFHVDDHPLFCLGLQAALRDAPDLEFIGNGHSAATGLALAASLKLDVALVDMVMPDGDGIAFTAALHALQPDCKILGLSMVDEPLRVAEMVRAGASGYALKTESAPAILAAIRTVLGGVEYFSPSLSRTQLTQLETRGAHSVFRLTPREREIFELLIRGQSNDEIATSRFISRRTVETHRQRILRKLDAHSVVELVHIATRNGIA
ncbi:MAG: response regulator transcription factor [Kofleriaceae bacterium]